MGLHAPWHLLLQVGSQGLWAAGLRCLHSLHPSCIYSSSALCCSQTHCFLSSWPFPPSSHYSLLLVWCFPMILAFSDLTTCPNSQIPLFLQDPYHTPSTQRCTSHLDMVAASSRPRPHICISLGTQHTLCLHGSFCSCVFCLWTSLEALLERMSLIQFPLCPTNRCSMHFG